MTQSKSFLRRVVQTLGFIGLQIGLVFAIVEIGLRVATPRSRNLQRLLYRPSAKVDYGNAQTVQELLERTLLGFKPYETYYGFTLNSRSLRTREYAIAKPPESYRVLAFGDSFTFASGGLPHADHWPTILESELTRRRGGPIEVLRLGVPGTGPQFQSRLWQLEGRQLDADLVIQAFFVGNDFWDGQGVGGLRGQDSSWGWSYSLMTFARLIHVSNALSLLPEGFSSKKQPEVSAIERGGSANLEYGRRFNPDQPSFSREAFLGIEAKRMKLCLKADRQRFETAAAEVGRALRAFHHDVTGRGGRYAVMIIPDEYQVHPEIRQAALALTGARAEDYDFTLPQRRLRTILTRAGIDHLDLLPFFEQQGQQERLYRPQDTHWNLAGNRLAASLLARYLEGEDLEVKAANRDR